MSRFPEPPPPPLNHYQKRAPVSLKYSLHRRPHRRSHGQGGRWDLWCWIVVGAAAGYFLAHLIVRHWD